MSSQVLEQKKDLVDVGYLVKRVRSAHTRFMEVADELDRVLKEAEVSLPAVGSHLGLIRKCGNAACGKAYTEKRREDAPQHGFCSSECYHNSVIE